MADKSLLMDNRSADLLLAYAALVAQIGRGDHVSLQAIGIDGQEVEVGFLLNSGTVMLIESSTSTLPAPDNHAGIEYMQQQLDSYGLDGHDDPHPFELDSDADQA